MISWAPIQFVPSPLLQVPTTAQPQLAPADAGALAFTLPVLWQPDAAATQARAGVQGWPAWQPPATVAPVAAASADDDGARVLQLVNDVRAQHGLAPLKRSAALDRRAAAHSDAMAAGGSMYHSNFRGAARAENVAAGYDSPEAVVQGWLDSPGHRRNLLGDHRTMGIANSGGFWTQQFSR